MDQQWAEQSAAKDTRCTFVLPLLVINNNRRSLMNCSKYIVLQRKQDEVGEKQRDEDNRQ
jgi:hypothetical protein